MIAAAPADSSYARLFESGPPMRLQALVGLVKAGRPNVVRRAALVIFIGWLPLLLLSAFAGSSAGMNSFVSDIGVHARSLIAAPLLILAEAVCAPQLGAIARYFIDGHLVADRQRPEFDRAAASTGVMLRAIKIEVLVVALGYLSVIALWMSLPLVEVPLWHRGASSFTAAGWWHVLVSLPILIVLLLGWVWRLVLWTRFLWLVSRLDLRLVPAHPDNAAGLRFVGYSVRAFSIVAMALAAIVAGRLANDVLITGSVPLIEMAASAAILAFIALVFSGPVFVFADLMLKAWQRGVHEYGALANEVGQLFEQKWLTAGQQPGQDALASPDFSAAADLYQVAGNVYQMKVIPIDLQSILMLIGMMLLPFVPVVLLAFPIEQIWRSIGKLLF